HGAREDVERQPVSADDDNGLASSVRWYLDEDVEDEPVEDAEATPPGTAPQEAVSEGAADHSDESRHGAGEGHGDGDGDGDGDGEQVDPDTAAHFDLDVQRYDDNTPLPEDFVEEEQP